MRVVALVSGGKDSCFNMMHCIANGHDIVALANLKPECQNDEIDSFMYQTVGHHVIDLYAEAMGLPLFRRTITGSTKCDLSTYQQESGDEVEDLYELLKQIKEKISFDGISSGAILSNYQRVRVENVCSRLNLKSLAYLWRRDQTELLSEMVQAEVNAIIIKVAALGLSEKHLGKSLAEIEPHMLKQSKQFGLNPCGEGGEYETLTLDCPIFLKKIVVDESKVILHSDDAFAPVAYLSFSKMHLEDKGMAHDASLSDRLKNTKIKKLLPKWFDVDEFEETLSSNMADEVPTKDNSSQLNTVINPVVKTTEKKIWISELYCVKEENMEFESCVIKSMCMLKDMVETNKFSLKELSLVHLYVNNMQQFPRINKIYGQYFKVNPPSRVCVELELPANVIFKMEAIGHKLSSCEKETLHVQSISYWAPANIGPYSQANKIDNQVTYYSGSIGMDPSNLKIAYGFSQQALLSLHHVTKLQHVIGEDSINHCYGHIICYVTHKKYFETIYSIYSTQEMFPESRFGLTLVAVPRLPNTADVEWNVTTCAHASDKTFDGDDDHDGSDPEEIVKETLKHFSRNVLLSELEEHNNNVGKLLSIILREKCFLACNMFKLFYVSKKLHNTDLSSVISNILSDDTLPYKDIAYSLVPVDHIHPDTTVMSFIVT